MMIRSAAIAASTIALLAVAAVPAAQAAAPATAHSVAQAAVKKGGPVAVLATGGDKTLAVSWRPPTFTVDKNGDPLAKYDIKYDVSVNGQKVTESRTGSTSMSVKTLADDNSLLTENTKYTVAVTSYVNAKKTGTTTTVGLTKPGQVIYPTISGPMAGPTLKWDAPEHASEPLTYTIKVGANLYKVGVPETFVVLPPVECDKSLSVTVQAVNPSGEGKASSASVKGDKCPKAA